METNLLDKMLSLYHSQKTPVTIVLQNKNRITGLIGTFDSYVIVMESAKREIVYRHAISSVLAGIAEAHPQPAALKAVQAKAVQKQAPKQAPRPARAIQREKNRQPRQEPKAAPTSEAGLNTGMKEGLLKWMQEQKAGK